MSSNKSKLLCVALVFGGVFALSSLSTSEELETEVATAVEQHIKKRLKVEKPAKSSPTFSITCGNSTQITSQCPFNPRPPPSSISSVGAIEDHGGWYYTRQLIATEHVAFDPGLGPALIEYLLNTSSPSSSSENIVEMYDIGAGVGQWAAFVAGSQQHRKIHVSSFDGSSNIECFRGEDVQLRGEQALHRVPSDICHINAVVLISVFADASIRERDNDRLPQKEWVISLEVGEHIPKRFEQHYLDNLVRLSSRGVILSWAKKGQKGHGHVNEQNNVYVIEQMALRGMMYDERQTLALRKSVQKLKWLSKTLTVFLRAGKDKEKTSGRN